MEASSTSNAVRGGRGDDATVPFVIERAAVV
jgi:hypothetical protein